MKRSKAGVAGLLYGLTFPDVVSANGFVRERQDASVSFRDVVSANGFVRERQDASVSFPDAVTVNSFVRRGRTHRFIFTIFCLCQYISRCSIPASTLLRLPVTSGCTFLSLQKATMWFIIFSMF